ncbi:hypothetical protein Lal_00025026 [Lupinus albus]|nr:hypothetical protein Lal_00025026 [Lupinus albus]
MYCPPTFNEEVHYMEDPYLDRTHKLEDTLQTFMELTMEHQRRTKVSLRNLETQLGVITSYMSQNQVSQPEEQPSIPVNIEHQPSIQEVEEHKSKGVEIKSVVNGEMVNTCMLGLTLNFVGLRTVQTLRMGIGELNVIIISKLRRVGIDV